MFKKRTKTSWLINYLDTEAKCKMSSSKNLPARGFAAGVWGPEPQPPPHIQCICEYSILIYTGRGRRVEPERGLEGHQFTKLGRKYQHDGMITPPFIPFITFSSFTEPCYVQTLFSLNCLKVTISEFLHNCFRVSCGAFDNKKKLYIIHRPGN